MKTYTFELTTNPFTNEEVLLTNGFSLLSGWCLKLKDVARFINAIQMSHELTDSNLLKVFREADFKVPNIEFHGVLNDLDRPELFIVVDGTQIWSYIDTNAIKEFASILYVLDLPFEYKLKYEPDKIPGVVKMTGVEYIDFIDNYEDIPYVKYFRLQIKNNAEIFPDDRNYSLYCNDMVCTENLALDFADILNLLSRSGASLAANRLEETSFIIYPEIDELPNIEFRCIIRQISPEDVTKGYRRYVQLIVNGQKLYSDCFKIFTDLMSLLTYLNLGFNYSVVIDNPECSYLDEWPLDYVTAQKIQYTSSLPQSLRDLPPDFSEEELNSLEGPIHEIYDYGVYNEPIHMIVRIVDRKTWMRIPLHNRYITYVFGEKTYVQILKNLLREENDSKFDT